MGPGHEIQTRYLSLDSDSAGKTLPYRDFAVFEARPVRDSEVRGGIVLIQEIFGVNSHIRKVAEYYARMHGFAVWAPALFDHVEKGVELGYVSESFPKGRELAAAVGFDVPIDDIRLAAARLSHSLPEGRQKIALIGFCWGGSLAWLSACRLTSTDIVTAVGYYGRHIHQFRDEQPRVPVLLHYGEHDASIPLDNVRDVQKAHPEIPVHVYAAGHGFNCDERADFDDVAARLAEERTFVFLERQGFNY